MGIQVIPLGAGQDVGRSCILVTIGGKNIMFDCGMHMGYSDSRRFPDFSFISKSGAFDANLDCVIISHFHLDHCGALPHFTEKHGFSGPIYMTYPTRAICPILLEDMRKVAVERKGETDFFTSNDIRNCMKKVTAVDLNEVIHVDEDLEIKAYYAGHVLGAAMFHVRVGNESIVYTGDYNMTADRHLGSAWIDRCRPDLLITESTYATTVRGSKRTREREFLKKVHDCVKSGGKVLIPVFALGRAQELCILVESYWERMEDLRGKVPVYFSAGLTERANEYYKLFINWTNETIKQTFVDRNMFDFKYINTFQQHFVDEPGPMVVFASPGMLHAGTSLHIFKKWCHNPKNMVILPGYCVAGTVGAKVLAGEKQIQIDMHTRVDVNLQVKNLSFSAHADAKGIIQLIHMCEPRNVMLVHGEKAKMRVLADTLQAEFGVRTFYPANGETLTIP
ncbi:beta-lactamase-like protein, partial [Phlyctochytrium arcticum]